MPWAAKMVGVMMRIWLLLAVLWFLLLGVTAFALGRSDPIHCAQDYVGKPMPADAIACNPYLWKHH